MTNEEAIKLIQKIEEDGRNVTFEHIEALNKAIEGLKNERPQDEWSLVEHKKNIDLVCPCCGYHRCNLAYGFSIEEVREQIKEDKSDDYLLPDFCERCGAKLGFGGNKG